MGCLYMNMKKYFTLIKINIVGVHAKFCIGVAIIDWSQHHYMSSQYNKHMTISHFDMYRHILIISMLHSSCVYGLISMLA